MVKKKNGPIVRAGIVSCTLCGLRCQKCYRRKNLGFGYLKYEDFVRFSDLNPSVRELEITTEFGGEIFLNPDLGRILEYAKARGIRIDSIGANLNSARPEMLEAMVKFGLYSLIVVLDGTSRDSAAVYRRGTDFGKVVENVRKINGYKRKYRTLVPYMLWHYTLMEHNSSVEDIRKAKAMAVDLYMDIEFKRDWNGYIPKNEAEVRELAGLEYSRPDDLPEIGPADVDNPPCAAMFERPVVNWDGRFIGCANGAGTLGSPGLAFEKSIAECLAMPRSRAMREAAMGGGIRAGVPCLFCDFYKRMVCAGSFVRGRLQ